MDLYGKRWGFISQTYYKNEVAAETLRVYYTRSVEQTNRIISVCNAIIDFRETTILQRRIIYRIAFETKFRLEMFAYHASVRNGIEAVQPTLPAVLNFPQILNSMNLSSQDPAEEKWYRKKAEFLRLEELLPAV